MVPIRLRALLRKRQVEAAMDEELRFHLESQIEQNERAGLGPEEARYAALRSFGGVEQVKEQCREQLVVGWIESFWQDVRFGARALVKNPAFTAIVVFTLALGIGATTAVFSVVNKVLLQPLPFQDPNRLVMLWESNPETGMEKDQVSLANIAEWREQNEVFERIGFLQNWQTFSRNFLLQSGDTVDRVRGRYASAGFFEVLGVQPILGRTFLEEEDEASGSRVAILSHGLWQSRFSGDPNVLGQTFDVITSDPEPDAVNGAVSVVGVMPPGFGFPPDAQLWLSYGQSSTPRRMQRLWANHGMHTVWGVAKLKPNVALAQARTEMNLIQGRIAEAHPEVARLATQVEVVPLLEQVVGSNTRPALLVLLAAVALVLLIACTNVANLLLARATARQKEIAIRAALGAGRLRVVRQLLTEGLLLALLGGGIGVLFAVWGIEFLQAIRGDDTYHGVTEIRFDRINEATVDGAVLAFSLAVSVLTGMVFGLVSALETAKLDVNETLKLEGRSTTTGHTALRLRKLLLVSQMALALSLLIGAGLMMRSFFRMQAIDTGLKPDHLLLADLDLGMAAFKYSGEAQDVYDQVRERIESVPGVEAVSGVATNPLVKSGYQNAIAVEGQAASARGEMPMIGIRICAPGAFSTLGVPLLAGRDFTEHDRDGAVRVAIVNESAARRLFGDQDPLGQRVALRGGLFPWREIVGVVGDVRNFSLEAGDWTELYVPYRQGIFYGSEVGPMIVVRTHADPLRTTTALRHTVEGDDSNRPILVNFKTVEQVLANTVSHERFRTVLLGFFGGSALLLAAVGIYGVMSYLVTQRIHEIGIRLALGARRADILKLVLGQALVLSLAGVIAGLALSLAGARALSSLLYDVASTDPVTYVAVAVLLVGVALVASYVPARRALRVDPMVALRYE